MAYRGLKISNSFNDAHETTRKDKVQYFFFRRGGNKPNEGVYIIIRD